MHAYLPLFQVMGLVVALVVVHGVLKVVRRYRALPTLAEYREENPECATESGPRCCECGAKAIWRERFMGDTRLIFSCRDCGEPLYKR